MPKISILVAVYNTAAYLPQCLDSLLSQTLKDIEVLCVDDASTDKSLDILHQYAEKDERVKVFALKENHGIGYARNMALSNASGDYICFVDSDDWLASTALEKVCEAFTDEVDSVLFQVVHHYANGEEKSFLCLISTRCQAQRLLRKASHGRYMVCMQLEEISTIPILMTTHF